MESILAPAGSTLFHIAAQYLNDATLWYRLAAVNNLPDPFISKTTPISIPVKDYRGALDTRRR